MSLLYTIPFLRRHQPKVPLDMRVRRRRHRRRHRLQHSILVVRISHHHCIALVLPPRRFATNECADCEGRSGGKMRRVVRGIKIHKDSPRILAIAFSAETHHERGRWSANLAVSDTSAEGITDACQISKCNACFCCLVFCRLCHGAKRRCGRS